MFLCHKCAVLSAHNVLPTFKKLHVFFKRPDQKKTSHEQSAKRKSHERTKKKNHHVETCCLINLQWGAGRLPSLLIQIHKQVNDDLREQHWIYTSKETPCRKTLRNCVYFRALCYYFKSSLIQQLELCNEHREAEPPRGTWLWSLFPSQGGNSQQKLQRRTEKYPACKCFWNILPCTF